MSSLPDQPVLIVGANMVGAAQALSLAREHIPVTIVEPQLPAPFNPESEPDVRVSAINLASEGLLRRFGAWEGVQRQRCHPYKQLAVWEKSAPASPFPFAARLGNRTDFHASEIAVPYLGHMIENVVIQRALLEAIAEEPLVTLIPDVGLARIEQHQVDGVSVTLSNGERHEGCLLIGADGAQSEVRKEAGLQLREDRYSQQAMVIGIRHAGPARDITWQAFRPAGPLAYLPLADVNGQSYGSLVWYEEPARLAELMALDDNALLARIVREFPADLPQPEAITARARFPLIKRHARRYGCAGVLLVGDAAHTINPLAGQGVNLGFRDVAGLTRALVEGIDQRYPPGHPWVLKRYEHYRRLDNLMMMSLMDAFYYLFSNDIGPLKTLRNLGLGLASKMPMARRQVLGYATGQLASAP